MPPFIAPDESQEIQEVGEVQIDESGSDTAVVRKPKYMRQRSRTQQSGEIVQADNQPQEETPGETGTNGEDSPGAATNDASGTLQ